MVHSHCVTPLTFRHNEQVEAIEEMKDTDASTVKTILLSHSMGGLIAVDSFLSMIDDNDPTHSSILGIIAYDTPYFGLNPPVIHRTISTRVNTPSSAVNTARDWIPSSLYTPKSTALVQNTAPPKSTWGLGKTIAASVAGVAAVGAISYFAKDPVVNHLQFVKVLYKPDELARRMKRLEQTRGGTGFACFYTVVVDKVEGGERTFCNLPVGGERVEGRWIRQENGVAKDEVEAHCGMFLRRENDHYEEMCRQSIRIIRDWIGTRN